MFQTIVFAATARLQIQFRDDQCKRCDITCEHRYCGCFPRSIVAKQSGDLSLIHVQRASRHSHLLVEDLCTCIQRSVLSIIRPFLCAVGGTSRSVDVQEISQTPTHPPTPQSHSTNTFAFGVLSGDSRSTQNWRSFWWTAANPALFGAITWSRVFSPS